MAMMSENHNDYLERYFDSTMNNMKSILMVVVIYQTIKGGEINMWILMRMMIEMIHKMKIEWMRTENNNYDKSE